LKKFSAKSQGNGHNIGIVEIIGGKLMKIIKHRAY
jgi:hypothetical protein